MSVEASNPSVASGKKFPCASTLRSQATSDMRCAPLPMRRDLPGFAHHAWNLCLPLQALLSLSAYCYRSTCPSERLEYAIPALDEYYKSSLRQHAMRSLESRA
eukprot:872850-Amphidinium_carterae.2